MRNCTEKTIAMLSAAAMGIVLCGTAGAASYTWNNPAAGGNWNDQTQWTANSGFPNADGDTANLNVDFTGPVEIDLQQDITIGTLNIGDTGAAVSPVTLDPFNSTNTLTFQSAAPGGSTAINVTGNAVATTVINSKIALGGTSSLNIHGDPVDRTLQTQNTFNTGTSANTITVDGGMNQRTTWNISGDLAGSATIIKNGPGGMSINAGPNVVPIGQIFNGVASFTGRIILNQGLSGTSNAGSLSIATGSIKNASEIVLNGYLPSGTGILTSSSGYTTTGSFHVGSSSAFGANPGQRITSNTLTFNGGIFEDVGQSASVNPAGTPWQQGLETVSDTTNLVHFNSGYSLGLFGASTSTAGTRWNMTTLSREVGAATYFRSGTSAQGALGDTVRVTAGNGASFNKGAGGAAGSTTMSIVPWMLATTGNGNQQVPSNFATYDTTVVGGTVVGFRPLVTATEFATSITAGATTNVRLANFAALASDAVVNSLTYTSTGTSPIGTGATLTITSGGLYFTNNGAIGGAGLATAGTLNFGTAEGVVWSVGSSGTPMVNSIGSVVAGSGGLTKSGAGTLSLLGANTYTGKTVVSSGFLKVGNGTNASNLGSSASSDVEVAIGAELFLLNGAAINDGATLILDQYGLYNGTIDIGSGINEIVGGLSLGGVLQSPGTYGGAGSGATFILPTYFQNTGTLTVVPEPTSLGLLAVGTALVLKRRRQA